MHTIDRKRVFPLTGQKRSGAKKVDKIIRIRKNPDSPENAMWVDTRAVAPIKDGTIIYDDPVLNSLMINSLSKSDTRICDAMTHYFKTNTCTVSDKLYRVKGFVWVEIKKDDLRNEFVKLYDTMEIFMRNDVSMPERTKQDGYYIIDSIKDKLIDPQKSGHISNYVMINLQKDGFDTNVNLIAFKNGVFDMSTGVFRNGTAGDMINRTLSYDYSPEYADESGMMDGLNCIFPDANMLNYFLTFLAMGMCRRNCDESLLVLHAMNKGVAGLVTTVIDDSLEQYVYHHNDTTQKTNTLEALQNARVLMIDSHKTISHDVINQYVRKKTITMPRDTVATFNANVISVCTSYPVIENTVTNRVGLIQLPAVASTCEIKKNDFMLLLFKIIAQRDNLDKTCVQVAIKDNPKNLKNSAICGRFLRGCTTSSDANVKSIDVYNRYLKWAEANNEPIITKQKLFIELKKTISYKKDVYFDGKKTTAFIGIELVDEYNNPGVANIGRPVTHGACQGVDGVCPYDNKISGKYDNHCKHCFCNLFPDDPRTKGINTKSKEIQVVNHVCLNHPGEWYNDKPLYVNFDDKCCPSKRRIDLRQLFGNTMLCIEIDENQHKYYTKHDDFVRYNEIAFEFTCKYIFIRYNPDDYRVNGVVTHVATRARLARLSEEISKQIAIIASGKNEDYLEIIHLFYDE